MSDCKVHNDITGVILSGGKSSRMGLNKSFLKIGNQTIIERILDLMKSIFSEVIIITNSLKEYQYLNVPMYQDFYKWKGPLAGIHSALKNSNTEKNFIISCDVPLMSKEMIEYIINYKTGKPIKFCKAAGYHLPLVGVYSKKIFGELGLFLVENESNDKSFHKFLHNVDAEIIDPPSLPFYKDELFLNINSPEDFKQLIS